jgi:hypothetical protein
MSEDLAMSPAPTPPLPSERLRALVASGGAVRLRVPARELLLVALVFFAWGALVVAKLGMRRDLPALPMPPYLVSASSWALAAMLALVVVILPARGQVLPSLGRARAALIALPLFAAFVAAAFLVDAPGHSLLAPSSTVPHFIVHCLGIGLLVSLLPVAIAIYLSRAQLVVGDGSLGALFGVAAGLLAALVLHVVCPVAGMTHMLLGHAGGIVLAALIGTAIARFFARR